MLHTFSNWLRLTKSLQVYIHHIHPMWCDRKAKTRDLILVVTSPLLGLLHSGRVPFDFQAKRIVKEGVRRRSNILKVILILVNSFRARIKLIIPGTISHCKRRQRCLLSASKPGRPAISRTIPELSGAAG